MDYVVSKKILECFVSDSKCSEILFHFYGVNPDRIVFNNNILDDYARLEHENIRSWLNIIAMNTNSYRKIDCNDNFCSNEYVNVCLNTSDKKLIANEKEDYNDTNTDDIEIFNKLEAHTAFQSNSTVNIRGNDARVTLGNHSNITEGLDR